MRSEKETHRVSLDPSQRRRRETLISIETQIERSCWQAVRQPSSDKSRHAKNILRQDFKQIGIEATKADAETFLVEPGPILSWAGCSPSLVNTLLTVSGRHFATSCSYSQNRHPDLWSWAVILCKSNCLVIPEGLILALKVKKLSEGYIKDMTQSSFGGRL